MKIFLGADHNGYTLKETLEDHLKQSGHTVVDDGNLQLVSDDDFPQFAGKVVSDILASEDQDPRGILLCGSGQGMAIAANRFKGIRAIVAWDKEQARLGRNDDDSNVLALPAYLLKDSPQIAFGIVDTWLDTPYEAIPRRIRRIEQLDQIG